MNDGSDAGNEKDSRASLRNILHVFPEGNPHHNTRFIDFLTGLGDSLENVEQSFAAIGFLGSPELQIQNGVYVGQYSVFRSVIETVKPDVILFHGMFDNYYWQFLLENPNWGKKSVWVVWGGDLYNDILESSQSPRSFLKSLLFRIAKHLPFWHKAFVYFYERVMWRLKWPDSSITMIWKAFSLKRMGCVCAAMPQEQSLIKATYSTEIPMRELRYPLVLDGNKGTCDSCAPNDKSDVTVLLGNSGAPSNRHIEALEWLHSFKDEERLKIIIPLGYGGNDEYVRNVEEAGRSLFGDRAQILKETVSQKEYCSMLESVDALVFNHVRQQGMFNVIYCLKNGVKIFLRDDCPTFEWLGEKGGHIENTRSIPDLDFDAFSRPLDDDEQSVNNRLYEEMFSLASCQKAWAQFLQNPWKSRDS